MTELPAGWRMMALGDVAETALGKMLDRGKDRGLPRVRYLRNINVQWGRIDTDNLLEMELADDERERFGVVAGDLLVCEGGEIGRAAIWTGSTEYMAYQKALHRVRPGEHLDSRFLLHQFALLAQTSSLDRLATGSTIRHLPQQRLRQVPVVVPPLAEQRRIVDILEDHLSRLDAANDYLDAAARRADRLAATLLWQHTHAFSDSCTPRRLDEFADVRLGRQRSPANRSGARMRPYLRAANVDWDTLRLDDVKEMHFSETEESTYRLLPGDILVVEASGSPREAGKSAVYDGEPVGVCFQNTLLRVRTTTGTDPRFLQKFLLAEAMAGTFVQGSRGVGINHIGRAQLATLQVPLPPLTEQREASAACERALESTSRLSASTSAARARGTALRNSLLAAAFAGELTGRSSDLDRAEEMAFS